MSDDDDKPGIVDRLRARYAWFDRVMRAEERYMECKGDFFAAGITYFTVFAIFPLLMVSFSIAGFVLASQPDLLDEVDNLVKKTVSGEMGQQVSDLIDTAVESRTSVGLIGLAIALWAGLGWMANLREALSEMWAQRHEPGNFLQTKLSDLAALGSLLLAILVTVALTALSDRGLMRKILSLFGLDNVPGLGLALQGVSILVAMAISWLLFTWVIARLPRESVSFRSAIRAGLLAAVAFEVFKQLASFYLQSVVRGPAGATFGPVLGLLVFCYITARLMLFATAWAATSADNLANAAVPPPGPVVVTSAVRPREGIGPRGFAVAVITGVVGGLGMSRLLRHR